MYIHGRNPIIEAIKAGQQVAKIFIRFGSHGETVREMKALARVHRIPTMELPKKKFERFGTSSNDQGIVALVEDVRTLELVELLALDRDESLFFVALDSITDPHNVGAIIRSAECAGAHGIILPTRDSSPLTDTVVKTSAGATAHIPIARVGNLHQALVELRKQDVWIAGLDERGESDLLAFDGARPLCLVIGSEGKGLRPLIRKTCDLLLRIPTWGSIDSLNASVAAALAMYEVRRKRLNTT